MPQRIKNTDARLVLSFLTILLSAMLLSTGSSASANREASANVTASANYSMHTSETPNMRTYPSSQAVVTRKNLSNFR